MKVLLTGASGFIGRYVASSLQQLGVNFVAVGRRPAGDWPSVAADLLEPGEIRRVLATVAPSHLLHLAWNATPGQFWTSPDNLRWCAASLALAHDFFEGGGTRAVMAGTCAEYAWCGNNVLCERDSVLAPATFYGQAKDAFRRAVEGYCETHGRSWAWGRIFWLYGPGEAPGRLVSDVAFALTNGRSVETGDGAAERDFLHVQDVADAFVAALRSDYVGPFNIGSGRAVAVRDLIERLGTVSGRSDLLRIGARPGRSDEPQRIVASTEILEYRIGFRPSFDLDRGLADTFEWWRRQASQSDA